MAPSPHLAWSIFQTWVLTLILRFTSFFIENVISQVMLLLLQRWANLFCHGPGNEYFRLCYNCYCNMKVDLEVMEKSGIAVSPNVHL